jgi:hypothetical protein
MYFLSGSVVAQFGKILLILAVISLFIEQKKRKRCRALRAGIDRNDLIGKGAFTLDIAGKTKTAYKELNLFHFLLLCWCL